MKFEVTEGSCSGTAVTCGGRGKGEGEWGRSPEWLSEVGGMTAKRVFRPSGACWGREHFPGAYAPGCILLPLRGCNDFPGSHSPGCILLPLRGCKTSPGLTPRAVFCCRYAAVTEDSGAATGRDSRFSVVGCWFPVLGRGAIGGGGTAENAGKRESNSTKYQVGLITEQGTQVRNPGQWRTF